MLPLVVVPSSIPLYDAAKLVQALRRFWKHLVLMLPSRLLHQLICPFFPIGSFITPQCREGFSHPQPFNRPDTSIGHVSWTYPHNLPNPSESDVIPCRSFKLSDSSFFILPPYSVQDSSALSPSWHLYLPRRTRSAKTRCRLCLASSRPPTFTVTDRARASCW